jgi:hypothetical protein
VAITIQYNHRYSEDNLAKTVGVVYNNFELLVLEFENDHQYGG